jgi:hypothetical protein
MQDNSVKNLKRISLGLDSSFAGANRHSRRPPTRRARQAAGRVARRINADPLAHVMRWLLMQS